MASLSGVQTRFENETFISGPEKKKSSKMSTYDKNIEKLSGSKKNIVRDICF